MGKPAPSTFLADATVCLARLSGHQTWFLWGPRGYSGNCMIVLDDRKEVLEKYWEQVEYVGTSADNRYALEKEIPVFICKACEIRFVRRVLAEREEVALGR